MKDQLVSISEGGTVTDSSIVIMEGPSLYAINEPPIVSTTVTVTDLCASSVSDESRIKKDYSLAVLSPNPIASVGALSINIQSEISIGNYLLCLRDALGKEVYHENKYLTGTEEKLTIQVGELPTGIYTS